MSLIICPDCGKSISDMAMSCPSCGRPMFNRTSSIRSRRRRKRRITITVTICIILAIFVGLAILFIFRPWGNENKWIEKVDSSVVYVVSLDLFDNPISQGSGFFLYDDKTVITNYHVIEGSSSVIVMTKEDIEYEVVSVRNYDVEGDLAILTIKDNTGLDPLKVGDSSELKKGDEVIAIGNPEGFQNVVSNGVLSGRVDNTYLQITAPISHGSSGGALLNEKGEVIGVTSAGLEEGQNLNFAIPIEAVEELYADHAYEKTLNDIKAENDSYYKIKEELSRALGDIEDAFTEDFMENVSHYKSNMFCTTMYVSSRDNSSLFLVKDKQNITNDVELDWINSFSPEKTGTIQVLFEAEIVNKDFVGGDYLTIIGTVINRFRDKLYICPVYITDGIKEFRGQISYVKYMQEGSESRDIPLDVRDLSECWIENNSNLFHRTSSCKNYFGPDEYIEDGYIYNFLVEDMLKDGRIPCFYCYGDRW